MTNNTDENVINAKTNSTTPITTAAADNSYKSNDNNENFNNASICW